MLNTVTVPTYKFFILPLSLAVSSSACMKMWKLETTAKGNIVYVSL